jgi:predicted nucleotide-binding protein (sugar kinase/HSP70/actin superfamily)
MTPTDIDALLADPRLDAAARDELLAFARAEAGALGLDASVEQWLEPPPAPFTRDQRARTTIWVSGLTWSQDLFLAAALRGVGYEVRTLPVPDDEALRAGKEFGNRGQCNPTYYTVGNLVKHLRRLEKDGLTRERIRDEHLFLTAGACGPCRFGTYVTEYRKALRDSGFEGFRVLLMEQKGEIEAASGSEAGLEFTPAFYRAVLLSFLTGDVLNLMGYRLRPYEVTPGATDAAVERCREVIIDAFERRRPLLAALWRCRALLGAVEVDRLRPKPVVSIIGEFWAMTTEGDGNYQLQRFLEQEGAEVLIQPITNWLLYLTWVARHDTDRRATLRRDDDARRGLAGKAAAWKTVLGLHAADLGIHGVFRALALAIGLRGWHLPDMARIARLADAHYDVELRGGEGHMEVGKVLDNVEGKHAHMVVSVKPFGCMPSSGVSDGVQSLITARHADTIFCPIETSGDGKVNAHSRVQMMLFRARERAKAEFDEAVRATGLSLDELRRRAAKDRRARSALHVPPHVVTGTGANQVLELARGRGRLGRVAALIGR